MIVSKGFDEPVGTKINEHLSGYPIFGINVGEHTNAIEVYTSADDRDEIILALQLLGFLKNTWEGKNKNKKSDVKL